MSELTKPEFSGESNRLYYCPRCKNSSPALTDSKGSEKVVSFPRPGRAPYVGRFLTCQHSIPESDRPVSYSNDEKFTDANPDPQVLRDINVKVTLEFLQMNQEQRENFILFHKAQYDMHRKAAKEAKYVLQVLDDECNKYIEKMGVDNGEEEKKRLQQRFDYVWKKPERRLEVLAKEKEREATKKEKVVKSVDAQMEKLRAMMRKLQ